MSKNIIRAFYYVEIELTSPLSIGNGVEITTDQDVLVDKEGKPFIPGSSIAGVLSSLNKEYGEDLFSKFIDQASDNERMSKVTVYDGVLADDSFKISTRDNVELAERKKKIEAAKFNYEIVETGAKFILRFELYQPNNDSRMDMNQCIDSFEELLAYMKSDLVSFGHKTSRGYGDFKVNYAGKKQFSEDDFEAYLNFDFMSVDKKDLNEIELDQILDQRFRLEIKAHQRGPISIREYNSNTDDVDYHHIHCNGKPVIPGTSLSGAFRHNMIHNLRLMLKGYPSYEDMSKKLEDLFGCSADHNYKVGHKSYIRFHESVIENATEVKMTHVKIDRFTGGAVNGALYDEKAVVNGNTTFVIDILPTKENFEFYKALLLMAIADMDQGLLAIGGLTSIGRGLFKIDSVKINDQKELTMDELAEVFDTEYISYVKDFIEDEKGRQK